jgi:hypothetical protein
VDTMHFRRDIHDAHVGVWNRQVGKSTFLAVLPSG